MRISRHRASRFGAQAGLSLAAMLCVATLGAQAPAVKPAENPAGKEAPIANAVQQRDKQALQSLLKKKADVNAPQSDGATALHWAAYLEDAETTAMLIRAGANVNATQQSTA